MKWKELNKKWVVCAAALVVVLSTFVPMSAEAAYNPYRYDVGVNEPSYDLYSGYLTVSAGNKWTCFYWRVSPAIYDKETNIDIESIMNITINGSLITFQARTNHLGYVSLREVNENGLSNLLLNTQFETATTHMVEMGSTVMAYSVKGQYVEVFGNKGFNYDSVTTLWAPENIIKTEIARTVTAIQEINTSFVSVLNQISTKLDTSNSYLSNLVSIESLSKSMSSVLNLIGSRTYTMVNRLDSITERTYKIMTDLTEFKDGMLKQSAEDKVVTDELAETSKEQSNKLNELNKQNQTEKLDPSTSSSSIEGNVDTNAIINYGTVLQVVTNNDYVLRCMLLVVSIGLVAYVLFGKKK